MKKFLDPKFITTIFTMFAITVNKKFGWGLSELELGASIAVSVNFIFAQLAVDFAKMNRAAAGGFSFRFGGQPPI
ncbi:hypothetical protein BG53_11085 [Paenibacillus darwinianus]|uniref:Uncharacterized protein n=1 Tax=Paenibacillus darwinianus TaxID=1380763 RepID=A0A9W5RZ78_9BACL|nr:hypothetical protein [Paenibacillus darwinianus]EXX84533.1 hypothetical protein BG52_10630 [Paenibacillus darwinianus]EXX84551.1 hypothetical protein BG53_11085 [Paenibacillus darwinianus]EXX92863.1 hypothetical protein CH50_00010 [Paenibacillus darwinianus]